MSRFIVHNTPLADLKVIERKKMEDTRGFLSRLFCLEELVDVGWNRPVFQVNHVFTQKRGTVRGLHLQGSPHAEMKLVSCLRGTVWDVVVDMRANSPTFLRWHAEELSSKNHRSFLIPEGFAHGLQVLEPNTEMVYLHSDVYAPKCEIGFNPRDPKLKITWPLPISEISIRDANQMMLVDTFLGVRL